MSRYSESMVGVDPFEAGTRTDLFELMQETTPFDAATMASLAPRRRDSARHARLESSRVRRESGRLAVRR